MEKNSPRWKLTKTDMQKVATGALVAITGSLLTYVSQVVGDIDFGTWTPIVVAFWSIIANIGRKWVADNS